MATKKKLHFNDFSSGTGLSSKGGITTSDLMTNGGDFDTNIGKFNAFVKKLINALKGVAFSGSYSDLSGRPSIPSSLSQLSGTYVNNVSMSGTDMKVSFSNGSVSTIPMPFEPKLVRGPMNTNGSYRTFANSDPYLLATVSVNLTFPCVLHLTNTAYEGDDCASSHDEYLVMTLKAKNGTYTALASGMVANDLTKTSEIQVSMPNSTSANVTYEN